LETRIPTRFQLTIILCLVLYSVVFTGSIASAADYDLVINNGRVMDPETNFDQVANVGVKDGMIAAITKNKIKGKDTIDAKGLEVAPGFIDGHQHCIELYALTG